MTLLLGSRKAFLSSCRLDFLYFRNNECLSFISCSSLIVIQGSLFLRDLRFFDGTCLLTSDRNVLFQKSVAESTFGASMGAFHQKI